VGEEHRRASYWIDLLKQRDNIDVDEVVLDPQNVAALNASYQVKRPGFAGQSNLLRPVDVAILGTQIHERFSWMQGKLDSGEYVCDACDGALDIPAKLDLASRFRIALDEVPLHCAATTANYLDPKATRPGVDRNLCSSAHPQELVEVLGPWPGGMQLARTATGWGFLEAGAALSPVIDKALAEHLSSGERGTLTAEHVVAGKEESVILPLHTTVAYANATRTRALVATKTGVGEFALQANGHEPLARPLTRRRMITQALSYLGSPYGLGGQDGGIDCSRLLLDVAGSFGIKLPRFSGWQALAGSYSFDVKDTGEEAKLALIDKVSRSGIVVLYVPSHIMFYLGRDAAGTPMAVHALSEYARPCANGEETAVLVGQVMVGSLELGRGTSKTSLLERIERITVFGPTRESPFR